MLRDEKSFKQVVDVVERYKRYTSNKWNKQNVYRYKIEDEMEKLINRKLLKKRFAFQYFIALASNIFHEIILGVLGKQTNIMLAYFE